MYITWACFRNVKKSETKFHRQRLSYYIARTSISGKAVVAKLCQSATKFERHSSETVTKYGKSGGWAAAKADFREVTKHADRNSVRMKADPSGRVSNIDEKKYELIVSLKS